MSNPNTNKPTSATSNDKPSAVASQVKPLTAPTNGTPPSGGTSTPPPAGSTAPADVSPDEGDEKEKIQYHVIVGKVETFPDVSKAEAFLNAPEAPQCTVIYGKISLVNEWHIIIGTIQSFMSLVKAQKFLKEPTAPTEFVMIRGRITAPEVRVSLRR